MDALLKRIAALSIAVVVAGCINIGVSAPARAQQLDMDAIFRCVATDDDGIAKCLAARVMILDNCTSCHNFAPVVTVQFERGGWHSLLLRHSRDYRSRALPDAELLLVEDYLVENFNESLPPPELPAAFLEAWTSY